MLLDALQLANRTGFISHFVIEGEAMAQQLRQLIQLNTLPELEQHRAQRILREINQPPSDISSPILTKALWSGC
ncbi:transcriptional regulator MalT [Citrobacter koseri]|uniref:Transcriptional regulator MalT n=1 Tax=Citrobacter koseri TaxID=545 RepID=A0A2X2W197_CITKO|nr:transcriptional regulator MalT [Citrobacter koseri]